MSKKSNKALLIVGGLAAIAVVYFVTRKPAAPSMPAGYVPPPAHPAASGSSSLLSIGEGLLSSLIKGGSTSPLAGLFGGSSSGDPATSTAGDPATSSPNLQGWGSGYDFTDPSTFLA